MKRIILFLLGLTLLTSGCPALSSGNQPPEELVVLSSSGSTTPDEVPGAVAKADFWENLIAPFLLLVLGLAIVGIWTADLLGGKFAGKGTFFQWQEGENLLWPHILAEYLCAIGLVLSAIGLFFLYSWARPLAFLSLGALIYSAVNSTGWVLARKSRIWYGIPIWISMIFAVVAAVLIW